MVAMSQSPRLEELLQQAIDARLAGVFTAMPGRIESYNRLTQTANVKPLVDTAYSDESGERIVEGLPVLQHVPVMMHGGGGFRITFPVEAGDTCLLVFANCSLDRWLLVGGEVDPGDYRRHSISDAVAICGLRARGDSILNASSSAISIGSDSGATIEISADEVQIGGDNNLVLRSEFLGHTHGAPGSPPVPLTPPGSLLDFPGTQILKGG